MAPFGTLYTHKPNPRSTAILAIAKKQGLELDVVYADRRDDAENHEKLLQINPLGQVPVFVGADGYVLTECIPIALHITSQSDTTTLLGTTRRDYLNTLRWLSFANSDLLPAQGGVILPLIGRPLAVRKDTTDCLRAFHVGCALLESHLSSSHKFLVRDDEPTLADFFTAGILYFGFMVMHGDLHAKYPRLTEWFARVHGVQWFREVAGELPLLSVPYPRLPEDEDVKAVSNGEGKKNGTAVTAAAVNGSGNGIKA